MARRGDGRTERIWRERLKRYRRCGLTVAAFCEREGVSTASFYAWKRRLGGRSSSGQPRSDEAPEEPPLFVPVSVKPTASTDVRIELPGGAVVRLPADADERLVRSCIRAAAERSGEAEGEAC